MKSKPLASITNPTTPRQRLAQRLKAWRESRPRGKRIPEELWQAAANLARVEGLNLTARALRLDYYDLQRRLGCTPRARQPKAAPATFMELPPPDRAARLEEGGTVELLKPSGARLRIHLPDTRAQDLLPVVRAFLRQRL